MNLVCPVHWPFKAEVFDGFFQPYEQELLNFEYLMHIAKGTEVRLNLDLHKETIEIFTVNQNPNTKTYAS